jgi:hypothetical protein
MDASTLKFHRALLRHMKGIVTAYGQWVEEAEAITATLQLKRERELLDKLRTKG